MINAESARYSLRNLNQRKARSFLTVFSVLVGITTIYIFISFGLGLYFFVQDISSDSTADKLIIQAKGGGVPGLDDTFALTKEEIEVIAKTTGVIKASGFAFEPVKVTNDDETKYVFLIAYEPKESWVIDIFSIEIEEGRALRPKDQKQVVLGYNYQIPGRIFEKPLEINDKLEINDQEFRVVGFYEEVGSPQDDSQIYFNVDYHEEFFNKTTSYAWIIAQAEIEGISKTIENVEKNLRKERGLEEGKEDFFVQSYEDLIATYANVLNIIVGFIVLIALISVLVSAINTANTMITSVLERYKEIGVLKAIGARNSNVFGIFLFESAFLGLLAGIIGATLGYGLSTLGGSILASLGWSFLKPYYSPALFIGCVLFATITGMISGAIPALRASKIQPVTALRYE